MHGKHRFIGDWWRWGAVTFAVVAAVPTVMVGAPKDVVSAKKERPKSKLGERLIREIAQGGDDDVMATVMRLMEDSGRRLDIDFDAGAETQAVQQEIVARLDEAILSAAKQRRRGRRRKQQSGDRRSKMARKQDSAKADEKGEQGQSNAESEQAGQRGSASQVDAAQGALRETRRGWGHLPPRERDEVIQGSEDASLERYREWIERYYRALQEIDE